MKIHAARRLQVVEAADLSHWASLLRKWGIPIDSQPLSKQPNKVVYRMKYEPDEDDLHSINSYLGDLSEQVLSTGWAYVWKRGVFTIRMLLPRTGSPQLEITT